MHSCERPSPLLNFLDTIQCPHCCRHFPPLLSVLTVKKETEPVENKTAYGYVEAGAGCCR